MEFFLKQTESGFSAKYQVIYNGRIVSVAEMNNNFVFGGSVVFNSFIDSQTYTLSYEPHQKPFATSAIPYCVYKGTGECLGKIMQSAKGKGFKVYEYFLFEYTGNHYEIYEIGLGQEGIKYPVFCNGAQIALIEKDCIVFNNLDEYRIFSVDLSSAFIAYISALYIDIIFYSNRGENNTKAKQKYYVKTTLKELKEKYDPNFKYRI